MAISEEINSPQPSEFQINNVDELSASEATAIENVVSTLQGIRAELESVLSDPNLGDTKRAEIQSGITTLTSSIKSLQGGKKGTLSAAIASASNAVNDCKEKITEDKQNAYSASIVEYSGVIQLGSLSSDDRSFMASNLSNTSWFGGLDKASQGFIINDISVQAGKDTELGAAITTARIISENKTLSNIKDTNIKENLAAINEAKAYAQKNDDTELLNAMVAGEKLIQTRSKVNDYTFKAEWDKANADGKITAEERKELIDFTKKEVERRKVDFKEIDSKVLNMFSKGEKASITKIYQDATGDKTPTEGEMQQFITKYQPDPKKINDFAAVMNKHAPPGSSPEQIQAALQMMSPEVRKDGLIAIYQSRMQTAEIAYDMKGMLQNLSPEQQKEFAANMQTMTKEEIIAMLETANGDKTLNKGIKELIMKSDAAHLDKIFSSVLKVDDAKSIRSFQTEISSVFLPRDSNDFNIINFYDPSKSSFAIEQNAKPLEKFSANPDNSKFGNLLVGFKAPEGVTTTNSNFNGIPTTGMNKNMVANKEVAFIRN